MPTNVALYDEAMHDFMDAINDIHKMSGRCIALVGQRNEHNTIEISDKIIDDMANTLHVALQQMNVAMPKLKQFRKSLTEKI